jgi:hypothetical protein
MQWIIHVIRIRIGMYAEIDSKMIQDVTFVAKSFAVLVVPFTIPIFLITAEMVIYLAAVSSECDPNESNAVLQACRLPLARSSPQ